MIKKTDQKFHVALLLRKIKFGKCESQGVFFIKEYFIIYEGKIRNYISLLDYTKLEKLSIPFVLNFGF